MTSASSTALPPAPTRSEAGVKETIESILIAFILAFIFRCFVVEAFVIPTGSMAPTLMGAHLSFRCPDCGYRFTAGFPDQNDTFTVPEQAKKTYSIICPNCGMRLPRTNEGDRDNDAENPIIRYGDRILVMKYLYLLHPPQRWDVVVFKTPDVGTGVGDYTVNYIKRLVGKPGEHLFVADGDLFVASDTGKPVKESDFEVQTKPRAAQDALWRIVYNADYVPVGLERKYQAATGGNFSDPAWRQPWTVVGGSGWILSDPGSGKSLRQFAFDNREGDGIIAFDPAAIPNSAPMTDWLAYDQTNSQPLPPRGEADSLDRPSYGVVGTTVKSISDLKLSATVADFDGNGGLKLVVGKKDESGNVEFVAEVTTDTIRLVKQLGGSRRVIGEITKPRGTLTVSIQNVDYRVAVNVNGHERIASTPTDYAPDITAIVRRAQTGAPGPVGYSRIEGDHCKAVISHVELWRDNYYRDTDPNIRRAYATDFPKHVVTLKADEFFTMGDNSVASLDGRYWSADVELKDEDLKVDAGIVPGRFLLGKAFFVYWPAGYRALPGVPPLLPNFGEMRFIR